MIRPDFVCARGYQVGDQITLIDFRRLRHCVVPMVITAVVSTARKISKHRKRRKR